ncbi:pyridoxal phosphate-dependent aminotransferase [Emergencia timonensis]|uniref:pyridoxal phosphate-dependent aminotransferase n=1 Tax=Emergencia timonensis TaxID=1776384 RepID=UPI0039955146
MMQMSKSALTMPTSGIRAMTVLAAKYDNVLSFGLGEPDFPTPQNIINAGRNALDEGWTKYVANQGIAPLLSSLAEKMRKYNGMEYVTEENLHITFGAGQALLLTMETILEPGDEVIVPTPCFPNYFGYIHMAGGTSVIVPTCEENGFRVTAEEIKAKITTRTKAIILNSPCNPTGAVLTEEDIRQIAAVAVEHNLIVISDEPYEAIIYDEQKNFSIGSIPEMKDLVITINSFSKSYAMTGWRIGYVAAPVEVREQMTLLQESMGSSVTAACQIAACEAITGSQESVERMRGQYERRRDILVEGLNQVQGFSCIKPGGAFYVFPNVKSFGISSQDLAVKILDQVQVLTTPGSAFGDSGEGYLRFSYASSEETIREGITRLKRMFGEK